MDGIAETERCGAVGQEVGTDLRAVRKGEPQKGQKGQCAQTPGGLTANEHKWARMGEG